MKVTTLVLFTFTVFLASCVHHSNGQHDDFVFPSGDGGFERPSRRPHRPNRRPTPPATMAPITMPPATTQSTTAAQTATTPTPQFLRCIATCPSTNEYNPVCGDDRLTYHNVQRLNCANSCGKQPRVQVSRMGACEQLGRPIFTNF